MENKNQSLNFPIATNLTRTEQALAGTNPCSSYRRQSCLRRGLQRWLRGPSASAGPVRRKSVGQAGDALVHSPAPPTTFPALSPPHGAPPAGSLPGTPGCAGPASPSSGLAQGTGGDDTGTGRGGHRTWGHIHHSATSVSHPFSKVLNQQNGHFPCKKD